MNVALALPVLAECVRASDRATVEFFVVPTVDKPVMYRPVAAVARQVLWQGEPSISQMAATASALLTHRALCKEPTLELIHG